MNKQRTIWKKTTILRILLTIIGISSAALCFFCIYFENLLNDFHRFSIEAFDSAFLSMYPIDTYNEEDFTYYRAKDTIQTTYEIPNELALKCYLWKIERTKQYVDTIYLGIQPDKVSGEKLAALLSSYPNYHFEVILSYPSLSYWTGLSERECERNIQAYRDCIPFLLEQANVSVYFYGNAEWLLANPANYESEFLTNEDISRSIMLLSDDSYSYILNSATYTSPLDEMEVLIAQARNTPSHYADLSGKSIVFFGDSVIGNFTNTTSIPNVTGGLTGANTYNLGYGGTPATKENAESYALSDIITAFLDKNPSALPADCQACIGLTQYLSAPSDSPYCFVITYGLNDYYNGAIIASQDPYDVYSFNGAFRSAIRDLRTAYPDARIIITTPNFTSYFNNGMDYMSEQNHIITDYVDALLAIADEMNVELLDNYNELDINADNHWNLLSDGCHPNEAGRFIMGARIATKLSN